MQKINIDLHDYRIHPFFYTVRFSSSYERKYTKYKNQPYSEHCQYDPLTMMNRNSCKLFVRNYPIIISNKNKELI